MTEQSPNDIFHASSFLQGANAEYIDQLYARYARDPNAVAQAWVEFFRSLGDTEMDVRKSADGPSWGRTDWPMQPNDDLTASLDGPMGGGPGQRGKGSRRQDQRQGRRKGCGA